MRDFNNVFMIGVGGMGMTPLAVYLAESGCHVEGYDDDLSEAVGNLLKQKGIVLRTEFQSETCYDAVIYSSAIHENHFLYKKAVERELRLVRRGHFLAELVKDKKLLAVVGSHGKTTTTNMLVHALKAQGFNFGYLIGGLPKNESLYPGHFSQGEWVISEVDESDGTIDAFSPAITLCVNFDWDHPDRYKTKESILETFRNLFLRTKERVILPANCPTLMGLSKDLKKIFTFGEKGDFSAKIQQQAGDEIIFETQGNFPQKTLKLPVGGEFNFKNAVAALTGAYAITNHLTEDCLGSSFRGIRRRQDVLLKSGHLTVMADYAHHPTEIDAFLCYARAHSPGRQIVVFEPHRYTRTRQYAKSFAEVLGKADAVFLMPVYAASEKEINDGKTETLFEFFDNKKNVSLLKGEEDFFNSLPNEFSQPTSLLFVGAGSIEKVAKEFVKKFLDKNFCKLQEGLSPDTRITCHEPLREKTTLRIGGKSLFYAEPANESDLIALLMRVHGLFPVFILGRGSNLLVPDEGFSGMVIRLSLPYWRTIEELGDGRLRVSAGTRLKEICMKACKQGYAGFEFLEGIPGTLGGALRMNAGALGDSILNTVESLEGLTLQGQKIFLEKSDLTFKYRECPEIKNIVVTGAILKARGEADSKAIRETMDTYALKRKNSQPQEPSAGCTFKNPENAEKIPAGKLIDELGLKGYTIGDAMVSQKHANFIINRGNATSNDFLQLVEFIEKKALSLKGIALQPEILMLR